MMSIKTCLYDQVSEGVSCIFFFFWNIWLGVWMVDSDKGIMTF